MGLERWKNIKDYPDYMVSDQGRVMSTKYKGTRILAPRLGATGYFFAALCSEGVQKSFAVHRLVAEAFLENPDNKPQVNHIDGNRKNNNISNLEWVTASENVKHAYKIGIMYRKGEAHPKVKLTERQVKEIYILAKTKKFIQRDIGRMYNISRETVSDIARGRTWSHITQNTNNMGECINGA